MSIVRLPATSSAYEQMQAFASRDKRVPGQAINGKPSLASAQAAERINNKGSDRWVDRDGNGRTELSYSFSQTSSSSFTDADLLGFSPFNEQQKAQMRRSLQSWSDVANIQFTETKNDGTGDGHLRFGNFSQIEGVKAPNGIGVTIYEPEDEVQQAWFRTGGYDANLNPTVNSAGRHNFTHEAGHQIGLHHPGNYGGPSKGYAKNAEYAQDSRAHSIMSYWKESETGQNFDKNAKRNYPSAPQMDDIVAAQQLYGANHSTRRGDTVYGLRSNSERDYYCATSPDQPMVASIWDAGGHDTLDLSLYRDNQKINLNAGTLSDVGGLKGNLSIAPGVVIEDAIGGAGDDLMLGNAADNSMVGGAGADVLDGGAGQDRLWGGSGKDTFLFSQASDSTAAAPDTIMDFQRGEDVIDVSNIRRTIGRPGLDFVSEFNGQAGQARLKYDPKKRLSSLEIDLHGKGMADFKVNVKGEVLKQDIV